MACKTYNGMTAEQIRDAIADHHFDTYYDKAFDEWCYEHDIDEVELTKWLEEQEA